MKETPGVRRSRNHRRRGAELIEFTLVMFPFFAFLFVTCDLCWALFAEGSIQYAVRRAVRYGVTNPKVPDLTAAIKASVQQESLGVLYGPSGLSQIKVHYYKPDTDTGALTDVSANPKGNAGGNVLVVSVSNFALVPLFPRVFTSGVDNSPVIFSVESADRIEPINDAELPPIGVAP